MRKSTSNTPALRVKLISAAVSACFVSGGAIANPTGGVVVNGAAMFASPAAGQLHITNTPNTIIHWQGFSIGASELTRFIQESAASAVLNRVVTNDPSSILGTLTSNGRVFVINPNGIAFGSGAVVDVAGFVASSLNLTDQDFLDGRFRFQAVPGAGGVSNHGTLRTAVGGPIYLVGPAVTNGGLIDNPGGEVILAAGESVELMGLGTPGLSVQITAPGNEAMNLGHISVDSGRLGIFAGLVTQGGGVSATSAVLGADGSIKLVAKDTTTFAAGSNTAGGPLDIETGDLVVAGVVTSGQQNIRAAGGVMVENGSLSAANGQTIEAGFVGVNATAGGFASISNTSGSQHISTTSANAAGEGLAVRSSGGIAGITSFLSDQRIDVRNADRLTVDGLSGVAQIVNIDGVQSVAVTGTGANALQLGASGGPGQSVIGGGGFQSILAGNTGEQGSITMTGPNSGMPSNPVFGGTQTISTSGALTITGGSAFGLPGSGISANGVNGLQTIRAESILLQGGASGSGNTAGIFANSGSQFIEVGGGGITLLGGAGGSNNFVQINQASTDLAATQRVQTTGSVLLQGGDSGSFNFAMIRGLGGQQVMALGDTTVRSGASGIDNFSVIQGRNQDLIVNGDLTLAAGGSGGTPTIGGGARIGGLGGGSPTGTNLTLEIDGDLRMTGGTVSGTGVLLGNTSTTDQATNVTVTAGRDVVLNPGSAPNALAAIGQRTGSLGGGSISVTAGGEIAMNSAAPDRFTRILTADGVFLDAQSISQGADARIEAGSLSVQTEEGASLTGQNSVGRFNATNAWHGDVALHNTSPLLTMTSVRNWNGGLQLQQVGDLLVNGTVVSGLQAIDVTGALTVRNEPFGFAQLSASGGQAINAGHLEVNAVVGGNAGVTNSGGVQSIFTSGANAAGDGFVVRNSGGNFANIDAFMGEQHVQVRNADRAVIDGAEGFAAVGNFEGVQTFSVTGSGANALVLGSPNARAQSVIGGGAHQTVVAGNPGEQGSITLIGTQGGQGNTLIVSNPVFGGTQTVRTTGALSVFGGSAVSNTAAGIFANGIAGQQYVSADSILLQGGDVGFGNTAFIGANNGSQVVSAGGGGITLRGGAAGGNNFAMINEVSTDSAATQTITSAGPVLLEGGSGSFNFAMIRAFGGHQDLTFGDTTLLAGAAGIDNFSVIQGRNQDLTVHGDLEITARGSAGSPTIGGGARIGGLGGGAPSPTQLRLNVDGDLTMTAGDASGTGVTLGNTSTFTGDTDISVNAGGNVTLNGGSVPDSLAAIGSRAGNVAGGDISITAGGTIALNSTAPDQASTIRTTEAVTLSAQQITQGPDAIIDAGSLSTTTVFGADLDGANALSTFYARNFAGGDVVLHNTSPLLTVTGVENFSGGLTLQQTGDLRVNGVVFTGVQDVDVSGGLIVQNEPFSFAQLSATGGQTIDAGYIEVIGSVGDGVAGGAIITNFGGDQRIATSGANGAGESLALKSSNGAAGTILSGGGRQSIMLTGPGPNALVMASADAMFGTGTSISGDQQMIVAGNPGESGSITLRGPISQINSSPLPGGSQTVTTSGTLTLAGSDTDFSFGPAGIFAASPDGQQTVRAESIQLRGGNGGNGAVIVAIGGSQLIEAGAGGISLTGAAAPGNGGAAIVQQSGGPSLTQTVRSGDAIVLQGGSLGGGNPAEIVANGGAQTIEAGGGGITLRGGDSGGNNFARIHQLSADPAATQTVVSAGDVRLEGGNGSLNFAMLRGFGGRQTLETGDLTLQSGPGGVNNFATIQARSQDVTVRGDLVIRAGGSAGTPGIGGGARIGGVGSGVQSGTDLTLAVEGNLTMAGGQVEGAGVSLGSHLVPDQPTSISATVGGDVTLAGGSAPDTHARMGSANSGTTGGDITLRAGGDLAMVDPGNGSHGKIETTGDVRIEARSVSQEGASTIKGDALTIVTAEGAALGGDNGVSILRISNRRNAVLFNNASALLTVTGIDQVPTGALSLSQDGNLLIHGDVTSGTQSIGATGDMTVTPGVGPNVTVQAYGPQTFNVGGSFSLLGGAEWNGYAQTLASGPVNITAGGDLNVRAGGGLLAYALLHGDHDLHLTVGDALRIDGGRWPGASARIQAGFWDRIFLTFPNRDSGGYFVDGREGRTVHGLDGFFTGLRPAVLGRSLVVTYGE